MAHGSMKPGGKYERMKPTGKKPATVRHKYSHGTEQGGSNQQVKKIMDRAQTMAANLDSGLFGRGGT